jgi:hypothetical protein
LVVLFNAGSAECGTHCHQRSNRVNPRSRCFRCSVTHYSPARRVPAYVGMLHASHVKLLAFRHEMLSNGGCARVVCLGCF